MKILHLVPLHVPASGIVQQAIAEQRAAEQADVDWQVRLYTDTDLPAEAEHLRIWAHAARKQTSRLSTWFQYVADKVAHRASLYRWLQQHHGEYDAIILRYLTSDLSRGRALKQISTPIISMHHTLELPELSLVPGYQGGLRVASERLLGPRSLRAATAIAGVTQEIIDYEVGRAGRQRPTILFPNGIDLNHERLATDARTETPEILFVASSFASWHGLDLLLDDLSNSDADFTLHLVGDLNETDRKRAERDSRVQVHGRLSRDSIGTLIARSWVGLSSFALERKNMKEACTLKVREYLAAGLATYSGHRDRFPIDAIYYREGPPEISRVLEYAHEVRLVTRSDIRAQSAPLISKVSIITQTSREIEQLLNK